MRVLLFALVSFVSTGQAQQSSGQATTYVYDPSGKRIATVTTSESKGPGGKSYSESVPTINGGSAPLERVTERVLREDSTGKVIERTVERFGTQGERLRPRKFEIEERTGSDGSRTVATKVLEADLSGNYKVVEKSSTEVRKTAGGEQSETVIQRPSINGELQVAEKTQNVLTMAGKTSNEETVTYRRDNNGRLYEFSRQSKEKTEVNGVVTENTAQYEADMAGKLALSGQTVARTSKQADGTETKLVDVFTTTIPGVARSKDATQPVLRERQTIVAKKGSDDTIVETTMVQRTSANDPNRLSSPEKISERVCTGKCPGN